MKRDRERKICVCVHRVGRYMIRERNKKRERAGKGKGNYTERVKGILNKQAKRYSSTVVAPHLLKNKYARIFDKID